MIKFEDGSELPAEDWYRIMSVIKERAKTGKPAPTEIRQNGVTIKLDGLEAKKDAKIKAGSGPDYAKYVEGKYKDWKIRVWRIERDEVYGVNYFIGETIRYMEVPYDYVRDENGVFKYVQTHIDEMEE